MHDGCAVKQWTAWSQVCIWIDYIMRASKAIQPCVYIEPCIYRHTGIPGIQPCIYRVFYPKITKATFFFWPVYYAWVPTRYIDWSCVCVLQEHKEHKSKERKEKKHKKEKKKSKHKDKDKDSLLKAAQEFLKKQIGGGFLTLFVPKLMMDFYQYYALNPHRCTMLWTLIVGDLVLCILQVPHSLLCHPS